VEATSEALEGSDLVGPVSSKNCFAKSHSHRLSAEIESLGGMSVDEAGVEEDGLEIRELTLELLGTQSD